MATQLDLEMAELGLDAAFAVGVADGILLTASRSPAVAAALTMPDARPIFVAVHLTTVRPPGSDEESVGIGVATQDSPWPVMDLLVGPDRLELLAVDPRSAHRALGGALVYCAARLRGTDTEDARWSVIREAFLAAWDDAPPIAMLGFEQTTLTYRAKGHATLPRSAASRARARGALFREILRRALPAGCWSGEEAVRLRKSEIIPAVESALLLGAGRLQDPHSERQMRPERATGARPSGGHRLAFRSITWRCVVAIRTALGFATTSHLVDLARQGA